MILNAITAPATEPFVISDVEGQTRLQGQLSAESSTVNLIISAVREQAEAVTRRALITQQWELVLDKFPLGRIPITLPKPPLQTVVSIKYIDVNNVEQTLDPLSYRVITDSSPACGYGYILPLYNLNWPVALNDTAVVKIQFVCGYTFPIFSVSVAYSVGQYVIYNNGAYKCKVATIAGDLPTLIAKWDVASLADAIPKAIKHWMLINIANLFENRESVLIEGSRGVILDATATLADGLIANYRLYRV